MAVVTAFYDSFISMSQIGWQRQVLKIDVPAEDQGEEVPRARMRRAMEVE